MNVEKSRFTPDGKRYYVNCGNYGLIDYTLDVNYEKTLWMDKWDILSAHNESFPLIDAFKEILTSFDSKRVNPNMVIMKHKHEINIKFVNLSRYVK